MNVLVAALILAGGLLMLLGAVGVVRMPDIYMRMHAATKPVLLGGGCLLGAAALYFGQLSLTTRAIFIIFVVLMTGPVSAHVIGRAAYFAGERLWDGTIRDDLRAHYDLRARHPGNAVDNSTIGERAQDPERIPGRAGDPADRSGGSISPTA